MVTKELIGRRPIPGINLPGRLENIVDTLFPKNAVTRRSPAEDRYVYPEITEREIIHQARKIPSGKAPGPDGDPDLVVKGIALNRPDILCKMFNMYFATGNFLAAWKKAKLVLLPKDNKPLDQLSSYRPICLLDTMGKFLERIIKERLDKYLESPGGLSELQFGFRKGKSTIDAMRKVMETVDSKFTGPLYRRELCVLIALDVANAFNSAMWDIIIGALEKKRVPSYLHQMVCSYLSDRSLIFGESKVREVSCGVSQGSVIGPILWNVMYDSLLEVDLGGKKCGLSSTSLVAFADDVAVVATGRTKQLLEEAANRALAAVSGWMKKNGLTLAANKTEAVVLTTKRCYEVPTFTVDGVLIEPKESVRYLGVSLCRKLGFRHHIQTAVVKANKTADALGRILPNVRGVKQQKRKLLATVVNNQLLYVAPIWAGALAFANNVETLEGP